MQMEQIKPKSYPTNLIKKDWTKRKCFTQADSQAFMDKIHDMPLRSDDIWLVTLAKCGTTWMQELLWLVINDYDFEQALNVNLEKRSPFMEFEYMVSHNMHTALEPLNKLKSPRLLKSHFPLPMLPAELWNGKHKIIYVYRNPKDTWVSLYYHFRSLGIFTEQSLEEFLNFYMNAMFEADNPFEHVREFYALRNKPWIYYTSYERMKSNLRQVIEEVCVFLNKPINEQQMEQMLHHLSFEQMKKNPTTNHEREFDQVRNKFKVPRDKIEKIDFVRKGKVGAYKEELSPELIEKLDNFIAQKLSALNLKLEDLLLLNEKTPE